MSVELIIYDKNIHLLNRLSPTLKSLDCSSIKLEYLPELPPTLENDSLLYISHKFKPISTNNNIIITTCESIILILINYKKINK